MTRPTQPDHRQDGLIQGAGETGAPLSHKLAWLPVLLFIAAMAVFYWLDIGVVYESQALLATLNTLFSSSVSILVVYLAARSYLATGSRPVLTLGCGALLFAIINLLGGILLTELNVALTIYNAGACLAGFCFVMSAVWAIIQKPREKAPAKAGSYLVFAYLCIVVAISVLILGAIAGVTPDFYVHGEGFTLLRQTVLGLTVIEFVLASVCFLALYRQSRTPFLLWYSLGLLLIGLGIGTVAIASNLGTVLNWTGRGGQYLGALYILVAVWTLKNSGGDIRIPLEKALKETEGKYRTIVETAAEGIWMADIEGRTTFVNKKMAEMIGYSPEEMTGKLAYDFMDEEARAIGRQNLKRRQKGLRDSFEQKYIRKDGSILWAIVSATPLWDKDGRVTGSMGMLTDITERKRTDEALRESQETLSSLVDRSPDGITMIDEEGKIIIWNQGEELITGLKAGDMLGKYIWDAQLMMGLDHEKTPENLEAVRTFTLEMLRTGVSPLLNKFHERSISVQEGTHKTIQALTFPVKTSKGYMLGSIMRDITERKHAEDALRASERDLCMAQSIAHLGFWVWDIDKNTLQWSDETFRILGLSSQDLSLDYQLFLTFVHPDDREEVNRSATEAINGTMPLDVKWRILRRDGSIRYAHSQGEVIAESGKPTRMIGTILDITERKRAEAALRASEETARQHAEELEKMMDVVPTAIWVSHDPHCHDIRGNMAANRFYEAKEGDNVSAGPAHIGQDTTRRFYRNGRELMPGELPMQEAAAKGLDVLGSEIEVLLPSGRQMTVLGNASPLRDADGNVRGCVAAFVDITERKRAEKELLEAKMQAELYLDLMGHDINNMHQIAIGYLELALDALDLDEGESELIVRPLETMKRSAKLIENVRKLQRVHAQEIKEDVVDLDEILDRVVREYRVIAGQKIAYNNGSGSHKVMANELLYDVFANLVGNAVKHTGVNGTLIMVNVGISWDSSKKYYVVRVEDNGPGIPDELKEKVFNRLQRGETMARGVGLGLYLVKSLVESYHGRVWVENLVPGDYTRGSRFVVMLPTSDN